jgi:plastocyanin
LLASLAVVGLLTTACGSADEATAALDPAASPATSATAPTPSSPSPTSAEVSAPSSAPAVAEPATITISSFEYGVPDSVPAGAELAVVNEDAEAHTFTVRDGESVVVQGGMTVTVAAPAAAGLYEVVCDFHGGMTATLVVV